MKCAFGFQELASRNPYLRELYDQGYEADFVGNYFVLYGLPYLDKDGGLQYGDLCSPLDLGEGGTIAAPSNHQVWWRGGRPHAKGGGELGLGILGLGIAEARVQVVPELVTDYAFSLKLRDSNQQSRTYGSFKEKVETYLALIVPPAQAAYPNAMPFRGIERRAAAQNSPLQLPDALSANYHLNDLADLLRKKKVAIIGLGGTGSYILDFIARTHLENIILFDDDIVHIHTLFRIPGFIDGAVGKTKVAALAQQYQKWHGGITAVPERITADNIERLREFDFVFVSVDDGPARRSIVDWLSASSIPFVDCGMGLNRVIGGLNGLVRITGVDRTAFEQTVDTQYLPTANAKDAEYRKQAQIAELNALNAALAVVRFKQHFQVYNRGDDAASYRFETSAFELEAKAHKT
jgi:hypothetical protein